MGTLNLLYKKEHPINEFISVRIPSVGEILECEDEYYGLVSMITAMPIDMMVQLDDIGVILAVVWLHKREGYLLDIWRFIIVTISTGNQCAKQYSDAHR